ncbi:MAG: hypothetical protein A3E83_00610 [Gammaproteobacteria bacterium RIFCSPHIGHO2_12_FULL_41_20]|nr:MAG: hypothetical protein A3E83_00610 [Gammaproteobacteria bacterium RIFCSPHIGHO2_12_FULL_41_20]
METNINYAAVGIFVIALLASIIFAIIWLSSGLYTGIQYKTYAVYMKESVSGLGLDAPVEYNGVNVGNVTSIQIDHHNPRLVELLLKIENDTPVTRGTRAKLDVRALSGIAYIQLVDKGADMSPLIKFPGQPYPIINTTPSLLVRLDTALTQISNNFHQLSDSVRELLDKDNLRAFKEILRSSQETIQLLETQTIPVTNQVMSNMDTITDGFADVLAEIKQNPSLLIRGKQQIPFGPGEKQ